MVLKKRRVSIPFPLRISIPSNSIWAVDVFLSCDHEDIFCSHLYLKLQSRGICTFQFFDAIEESRFAIVVLSQNYASSPRRLNELSKILERMKDRNRILPIFHDVNLFHVQKQKGTFEKAFAKHEEMFQDDLAKVEAWRDALTKVCNFAGWTSNDRNEVQVLEEITEAVWNKIHPRPRPTD
ncbi:PREDICTED: TMV resistance protein N-like [Fragaria vesca subsp. vesca]